MKASRTPAFVSSSVFLPGDGQPRDFGRAEAEAARGAAALCAFVPFVVSVAGASAPSVAVELRSRSAATAAGAPDPAFVGVSGVLLPACCRAFPAVVEVSGPVESSLC
jgi:hypothetical protein